MTWTNRFKMFFGLVLVVLVVGALTVVLSQRKGETTSSSASISAISYPIGTDYPGAVIDQPVAVGDVVAVGDPIATIQSNALLAQLEAGTTIASTDIYDVRDDGTLTIKSTVNGVVATVLIPQGGYAGAGATIAEISASEPLMVTAEFVLDPKDFARVEEGARVGLELPNGTVIAGQVDSFEVETVDGQAQAVVTVTSDDLIFGGNGGLVGPGTPIVATMTLRNDDVLARGVDSVREFVRDLTAALTS